MFIKWLTGLIKGKKRRERAKVEIEELKKALLEDPKFRDEVLRELEYRTGRRDLLKAGVLGLLGFTVGSIVGGEAGAVTQPVNSSVARDVVSDYAVKIPKPCTCIVAQDGTGDYDVSPGEDASEVIQKAIDYAHSKGGGEVRIREGRYNVVKKLKISSDNIHLSGCSAKLFISSEMGIEIRSEKRLNNVLLNGLQMVGNTRNIGVSAACVNNISFLCCRLYHFRQAISLKGCWGDCQLIFNSVLTGYPQSNEGVIQLESLNGKHTNSLEIFNTSINAYTRNGWCIYSSDDYIDNINMYRVYSESESNFMYANTIVRSQFENCIIRTKGYGYYFNNAHFVNIHSGEISKSVINNGEYVQINTNARYYDVYSDLLKHEPLLKISGLHHSISLRGYIYSSKAYIEIGHKNSFRDIIIENSFFSVLDVPVVILINKNGSDVYIRNCIFSNINKNNIFNKSYGIIAYANTYLFGCLFQNTVGYKPYQKSDKLKNYTNLLR